MGVASANYLLICSTPKIHSLIIRRKGRKCPRWENKTPIYPQFQGDPRFSTTNLATWFLDFEWIGSTLPEGKWNGSPDRTEQVGRNRWRLSSLPSLRDVLNGIAQKNGPPLIRLSQNRLDNKLLSTTTRKIPEWDQLQTLRTEGPWNVSKKTGSFRSPTPSGAEKGNTNMVMMVIFDHPAVASLGLALNRVTLPACPAAVEKWQHRLEQKKMKGSKETGPR